MAHERKKSPFLEEISRKWKENPIVEELPEEPVPGITKKKHIKELQELLVQACIDYINKNGLTDLHSVHFSADFLNESAKYGSWQPCTDSFIRAEGVKVRKFKRKNGEIFEMSERYDIGEYM